MTSPSLNALRDIHLPPAPALAATLSDWWLIATAAVLLAAVGWGVRRFLRRGHLRCALRELRRAAAVHAQYGDATQLAASLSSLLRQYAMMRFPQDRIAGITGPAWLEFLDTHGGGGAFGGGAGAVFDARPYQANGAFDAAALIALVRRWLKANP
jgi:hypothetical protein